VFRVEIERCYRCCDFLFPRRSGVMNLTTLLNKLIEIEQAIGTETDSVIRRKMQDAEDYVLEMQKEKASKIKGEHRHRFAF
jgi:hypothetical protein